MHKRKPLPLIHRASCGHKACVKKFYPGGATVYYV